MQTSQEALTRTRRMATAVLIALTTVFLGTYLIDEPPTAIMLIRAMAEAGMIGGLADWFAVSALFRHPLGIPIPHTALLPRNQAKAAKSAGRFIETHFLQPAQLEARILALEPSRHIADWLGRKENAALVARNLTDLAAAALKQEPSPRALARLRRWFRARAAHFGSDAAVADGLAEAIRIGMRSGFASDAISLVRQAIDERRDVAVEVVQENSRWWIASGVDRRVADLVVNGVLGLLDDLQRDDSRFREDFEGAFDDMINRLKSGGALTRTVAGVRQHLVRSDGFDQAFAGILKEFQASITSRLKDQPDALSGPLAEIIRDFAGKALAEPEARAALDARLAELAGRAIGEARPQIAAYVADVIAGWEPEELNARFEEEIGADLQFIRINGAVLGALIGGALFGVEALLG